MTVLVQSGYIDDNNELKSQERGRKVEGVLYSLSLKEYKEIFWDIDSSIII